LIFVVLSGDKVVVNDIYDPSKVIRRSDIVDRNGVIVATDLKTKSLYIDSALVKNPKLLANKLYEVFPDLSA
jgi:cell division protein FtsI (penicillin-binding protein 3)